MAGIDPKAGFSGLITSTGELPADAGGLRIADNVTLRKAGALECRPSFASSGAGPRLYKMLTWYKGAQYGLDQTGLWWRVATSQNINFGSYTQVRADVQSAKEARNNLYFPFTEGVWKVMNTADTFVTETGITPNWASIGYASAPLTGTNDLLAPNQQVAYRIVASYVDSNGVLIRSRPSGAVVVATGATNNGTPVISMYHSTFNAAGGRDRKIEVYRTRIFPITAQVDDEMQLVYTFDCNTTGSTGSPAFQDRLPDARRGTTLYTSPSRGGIENANDRAPGCAVVERFRNSLFFGNIVGPQRFVFSYTPSRTNLAGTATGIGIRQVNASSTAGSTSLTNVSNTTGLQVGMSVVASSAGVTYGRITNISGTTVTVSNPATLNSTNQSVLFYDAVLVDGLALPLGIGAYDNSTAWTVSTFATTSGGGYTFSEVRIQSAGYTVYEISPPVAGYDQTVVIERVARGGAAFQVRATHGDAMSPAIPLANQTVNYLTSTNDVLPNGLAWSEPDEPEHVPPKNFARVGDTGKAILGLVALRDCLLIIKEDGIFRLSGTGTSNYRIDTLDTTALCVCPGSIRRLANECYFLSNLGLVRVDDTSATVVSRNIQNEVATIVASIRTAAKASGLYYMPGLTGIVAASDDANAEYWLALGSSTPAFGGHVLVYNAHRDGFTTYTFTGSTLFALSTDSEGQPNAITTTAAQLTPTTTLGAVAARIQPHAWADPAVMGRLLTHFIAGFSSLTGTTSVQVKFTSSESMVAGTSITETMEAPVSAGLVQLPAGSLLRHPIPRAMTRAFLLLAELLVNVSNGSFVLELMGAESRDNAPNHRPTHASGAS